MKTKTAELLEKLAPAMRDVLWCAIVWNDHNHSYDEFLSKATAAADALGIKRGDVDAANELLREIDRTLCVGPLTQSAPPSRVPSGS